jgi:cell division protein ZapD
MLKTKSVSAMGPPINAVVYEQPLNERMRAFLRLEHLFRRAEHQLRDADVWASRATLEVIIDIMAVMSRADLKTELIKELDRHTQTLESLSISPQVDHERLDEILDQVKRLLSILRTIEQTPGNELRQNEFLAAIRQRNSIPAGTCDFDLPGYHFWLQSPTDQQHRDLEHWLSAFDLIRDATCLCLRLVRESSMATRERAAVGFFQKNLEKGSPCQMVRVVLPGDALLYPEISAGRHRFTIRFMEQHSLDIRPVQTDKDVDFELLCCVL